MEGNLIISAAALLIALLIGSALGYFIARTRPLAKKAVESKVFLNNVLQSVDNIVNYYEPVYDESGTITDFAIVYANECNREYLGISPEDIMGRPVSEVFPYVFVNGEFDGLVKCLSQQKKVILENRVTVKYGKLWFKTILKPLSDGVSVTARNMTNEREAEEALRALNDELKYRNRELREAESFLNGIFKSTDSIIHYLEPIRDGAGHITDFEIILMNHAPETLIGRDPEKYVGSNLLEVYPDFIDTGIFDILLECVQNGTMARMQVDLKLPKGSFSSYEATAVSTDLGIILTLKNIISEISDPGDRA